MLKIQKFGKSLRMFLLTLVHKNKNIKKESHDISDESVHLVYGYWSYDTAVQRVFVCGRRNMFEVV